MTQGASSFPIAIARCTEASQAQEAMTGDGEAMRSQAGVEKAKIQRAG